MATTPITQKTSPIKLLGMVAVFLLGLVLLDRLAGLAMEMLADRVHTGTHTGGLARAALEHTDADIVVFGTSRARHHIDPRVLDARLGTRTWNAGCDGQTIPYHLMMESLFLERGTTAKLFILTPEPIDFTARNQHAILMAPWVGESPKVDAILYSLSPFERLKLLSHGYRYNSLLLALLRNIVKPEASLEARGFVPMHGTVSPSIRGVPEELEVVSFEDLDNRETAERDHRLFIRRARQHGIAVLLTIGPRYWPESSPEDATRERILQRLAAIAEEEGASFTRLDEVSNPELNDPELMKDRVHLNAEGAVVFSRLLAEEVARLHPELVLLANEEAPSYE